MADETFVTSSEYASLFQDVLQELKERFVFAPTYERDRLNSLLLQYSDLLRGVMKDGDKWIDENIRNFFLQGDAFAQTVLPDVLGGVPVNTTFSQVHQGAIAVVAQTMKQFQNEAIATHISTLTRFIRQIKLAGVDKRVVMEEVARAVFSGDDTYSVSRNIETRLTARAIGGQIRVGKKLMPLSKYAELLARTNLRVAFTQGTILRLKSNNIRLVIVSEHGTECVICTPLEGRIFTLSSVSGKYPTIYATPNDGTPFHPN